MFPVFCIESGVIGKMGGVVGTVTRTTHGKKTWIGDRWLGFLKLGTQLVAGRWHARRGSWEFAPDVPDSVETLLAHPQWEVLDGYWGERAELVLDEARHWVREPFQPTDAIRFQQSAGVSLKPLTGTDVSPSSAEASRSGAKGTESDGSDFEVVPAGWDHEHCAICWDKIGVGGHIEGYVCAQGVWVCVRCYADFVERRSLNFIPNEGASPES